MASGITVKVRRNDLPRIAKQLPITADSIIMKRGAEMVDIARQHSRVDTGAMRDGWTWRRTSNASGVLENPVSYTVFHEMGTRFIEAQPMARPAAERVLPEIVDDFKHLEGLLS